MVQRKVPNSIGFQANHVKSEKRLGNLKPTYCQLQDGKNRGTDMKKKMKRSRSVKLPDMESLSSSSSRKTISQLGKPPTLSSPPAAATPQKQAVIKPSGGSPNYMKATSSSEARKERSQVSSSNTPPGSDSKNLRRTNSSSSSRLGSDSSNKSNKSSTKSYSLKLVRTLTKSPSFKPVRSAAKKCSRVALCADVNVQKATCSSTLKDSKFPAYLMLNPEGTESEGTSVLKVCPYTYCSLNGHHHTLLPPLKCFLKAKRRSLRAQKSSMLEVSSPRRVKPSGNQTEEINGELLKEMEMDFFIEIYDKSTADGRADATKKHAEADEEAVGFAGEPKEEHSKSSFHGDERAAEQENKDQVSENLSDASPHSEIGFEEILEGDFLKEHKTEDAAAGFPHFLSEEVRTGCYNNEIDTEGECHTTTEADDSISETSDMEWEVGQLSNSAIDTEVDYLNKLEKEYCIGVEYLSEIKQLDPLDEPKIIRSDDIISNCTKEILVDNVLQELFDNETASCTTKCYESDSEMEGMVGNWEILEPTQVDADLTCDQLSTVEYAFEESTAVEEKSKESAIVNENAHKDGECETENDIFEMNPQLEDAENNCNTSVTDDAVDLLPSQIADSSASSDETGNAESNKCQMHRETEADQILDITSSGPQELASGAAEYPIEEQKQVNYSYQGSDEATQDDAEFNDGQNHKIVQAQLEKISEDSNSTQELVNEIKLAQNFNHQLDGQQESTNDVENQNIFEKDQEGANKSKIPTSKGSEEQSDSNICKLNSAENETGVENMEVEVRTKSDVEQNSLMADNGTSTGSQSRYLGKESNSTQELADACSNRKCTIKCNKHIRDLEEERRFNPREPNFLPVVPDPEAEKVDLKHQIMDDRKNAEEWMVDYALRQAVTKLAPARKRKVALLVEAFETVLPIPKYDTHMRHTRSAFSHSRPIQACS